MRATVPVLSAIVDIPGWRVDGCRPRPDAALLVEDVQQEYVRRYGGRDATPSSRRSSPTDGLVFIGYLDDVR